MNGCPACGAVIAGDAVVCNRCLPVVAAAVVVTIDRRRQRATAALARIATDNERLERNFYRTVLGDR